MVRDNAVEKITGTGFLGFVLALELRASLSSVGICAQSSGRRAARLLTMTRSRGRTLTQTAWSWSSRAPVYFRSNDSRLQDAVSPRSTRSSPSPPSAGGCISRSRSMYTRRLRRAASPQKPVLGHRAREDLALPRVPPTMNVDAAERSRARQERAHSSEWVGGVSQSHVDRHVRSEREPEGGIQHAGVVVRRGIRDRRWNG